jgi:hypothetical protein
MGSTWRTIMHKPKGFAVLCTYHTFKVFYFQVLYPLAHVFLTGFYIGLIKFWVSVFGIIYRTLETFSLAPFHSMLIRSSRQ